MVLVVGAGEVSWVSLRGTVRCWTMRKEARVRREFVPECIVYVGYVAD